MTGRSRARVRGYLGFVYGSGALALPGVLLGARWAVPVDLRATLIVAAVLLVLAEFLPIRLWSHGDCQEYTISGAFVLVLLQSGTLAHAVLVQVLALLIVEVRDRKPP